MVTNTESMKGMSSPEGRKLTITIDKNPQQITKPKNISPRNKTTTVGMFPPIAEEHLFKKTQTSYPISPKSVQQEVSNVSFKQDNPPISPLQTTTGRRLSVSNGVGLVRNMTSLKSMGKFSTVLKAKMAFKSRCKRQPINPVVEEEEDLIIELPKEPRFSTTMSPEAQYAIMKGYEDTVYDYLCKEYPEHRPSLRRNKTPISKLDLRNRNEARNMHNEEDQDLNRELSARNDSEREESDSASQSSSIDSPLSSSTFTFPSPPLANISRRASMPITSISFKKFGRSGSLSTSPSVSDDSPLTRTNSLPSVIPREKQLVLSYRLQRAMDILDTVREGVGDNYTSPRVRASANKNIKPVLDYNKWAGVWGQEFNDLGKIKTK